MITHFFSKIYTNIKYLGLNVVCLLCCMSIAQAQEEQPKVPAEVQVPLLDANQLDEIAQYMKRVSGKIIQSENIIIGNAQRVAYLQLLLEEDAQQLKKAGNKEDLAEVQARIKSIKAIRKQTEKHKKRATKITSEIVALSEANPESIYEKLPLVKDYTAEMSEITFKVAELVQQSTNAQGIVEAQPETFTENQMPELSAPPSPATDSVNIIHEDASAATTEINQNTNRGYAKYDRDKDVLFNPPVTECADLRTEQDPFTGKDRLVTQQEEWFHFTNAFLSSTMKDKHHITSYASIIESSKKTFIHLKFVINDRNAARTFGSIKQDVPVLVKFVDGSILTLQNTLPDEGSMDPSNSFFTVNGILPIGKGEKDELMKKEIDKFRIPWSNGYEEYEIYRVDLIQRLLKCL